MSPEADRWMLLRRVSIDLSGVTFFGSAGVTALVWLSQHPEAAGKHAHTGAIARLAPRSAELGAVL